MNRFRGNESWVIRRVLYAVAFIVSVVVVLTGKSDIGTVEGWMKYVDQFGGILAAVATGLATVKTGPQSDNSPVVVPAEDVVSSVVPVEAVLEAMRPARDVLGDVVDIVGRAAGTPLDVVRTEVEKRG